MKPTFGNVPCVKSMIHVGLLRPKILSNLGMPISYHFCDPHTTVSELFQGSLEALELHVVAGCNLLTLWKGYKHKL